MRRWIVVGLAAGAVVVGSAVAGCMLVTGSTDGYNEADAGDSSTLIPGCTSAASCEGDGVTGPQVCCLSLSAASASCASSSCVLGDIQLCETAAECGASGPCNAQSCPFDGVTLTFNACGTIAGCVTDGGATGVQGRDSGTDTGADAALDGGAEATADAGTDAADAAD
jgi:hypothetical protein